MFVPTASFDYFSLLLHSLFHIDRITKVSSCRTFEHGPLLVVGPRMNLVKLALELFGSYHVSHLFLSDTQASSLINLKVAAWVV